MVEAVRRRVQGSHQFREGDQRRHRPDYQIILFMGLLMLVGLIVIYAIGPQRANVLNNSTGSDYSDSYFALKQGISLILALGAFVAMALIPFSLVKKYASWLLLAGIAACVALAFFGALHVEQIAQCTNGACRWISLGSFGTLQPAEILKFGMLIFVAGFLGRRMQQGAVNDVQKTLVPLGILTAVALFFIVVLQKDMGTGLSLLAILITMLLVSGLRLKLWVFVIGILAVAGVLLVLMAPHRIDRIVTFLEGDTTSSDDSSYQIDHAKMALGVGGLIGVGIGNSIQATGYLPESINDSVFAILGETFGFIGLMVILALFTGLLMRLLNITDHLTDPTMQLLVAGVFGWLGAHVLLNVAAMIGVIPLTGITLPLLSFGGTSMLFIAGGLGLVFQLSRYTQYRARNTEEGGAHEDSRSWRRIGRTRYAGRRSY